MTSNGLNNNSNRSTDGASTGQKLKGAVEVVHGIGENLRGRFMDTVDQSMQPSSTTDRSETHQGRMETEQGFARMRGEVPGVTSHWNVGTGTGGGDQYSNQPNAPYNNMNSSNVPGDLPMNAGLGAGAGVAPSQPPYQTTGGEANMAQQMGGSDRAYGGQHGADNNRDFQAGHGDPAQGGFEGAGTAPDQMDSGPGTGVSSAAPQRLP
ncbi:hypothetical protein EIP91_007695 [Steccherinum ochraceum]|uniref:Uncharacterized protein n=1 Tax=Steccherinum ochraceum TaxID=92696 RepID=A0A4V2MVC2_9APHY|nr:hypothetical protein EIP91_007695 [Steccherinum ochraceum]